MDSGDNIPNKVALVERNTAPQGIPLLNPYAVAKKSAHDLVELASEIQKADSFIRANAQNKLHIIAEQIHFLQKQAEKVLLEAKEQTFLHHAACNFVKHSGQIYHLYERESGQCYFSMLSPEEWGNRAPRQDYKGSFRLEHDQSWTPVSQINSRDDELTMINKLLDSNSRLTIELGQNSMHID
ncbi:uncharacterized protein C1orf50 homolog isoform X2 [Venturia canescens]|nr:uncharacterized protein C1orf50 homolog isoform X2 [Venturia canescens]XP_043281159.1 uncharacterized protein C1orf50 homolog isoform X2 [Venturia canescens]